MMSLSLTYQNVDKVYGGKGPSAVKALSDVSFVIEPGELFCLLGPSGCGKTTLLRSTAGLETITSGKILYGDTDMTVIPPYKRNIGMVFQSFALYPHMNIFENVAYGLRVRKTDNETVKKKVESVMELVGLQEELKRNPFPTALSGGQQQRVAIARALVYDPDILLLDEPLANLDAKLRRYMRAEIRRIQKATNITTIFVTHDQEEAMAVGDRLAVLRRGVVEQIGSSDELYTAPDNAFVANFIGKMNYFNAELTDKRSAKIHTTNITVSVSENNDRTKGAVAAGKDVFVGARPEMLEVTSEKDPSCISGKIQIIQHLGQVVRYEITVDKKISPVALEVDMPFLVKGLKERDDVSVRIKEGRAFLFKPEVNN
ncbi:ABC transporter ATP-binding protein [Treponema parvum]|uniref:ABC transporter ATP-binding protein n=1 Tax=Treponema parvum TaxID=138851 RepID=UPI001AEBEA6E|nr:ABC transporter ATP-binding protein [Treponema parvum]QTQ15263.1 ABC transporter ATP-binding protein [Treponema parvum]